MTLSGRLSLRPALLGNVLVLRVEERDANGNTTWRDATLEDLTELGGLSLAAAMPTRDSLALRRGEAAR